MKFRAYDCVYYFEGISNIVSDRIDPLSLPFDIENYVIQGKQIYAVKIQSGKDKPYLFGGRVYIRRSSTNKIANKYEVDSFYAQKNDPRSIYATV